MEEVEKHSVKDDDEEQQLEDSLVSVASHGNITFGNIHKAYRIPQFPP